jgi:hypothetical protein
MTQLYNDNIYEYLFPSILPLELSKIILSFLQYSQPKLLTNDIINYVARRNQFKEIYYNRWLNIYGPLEPDTSEWLVDVIISFANEFHPITINLVASMLTKWRQLFLLRDKDDEYITHFINRFCYYKNCNCLQLNTFLALFTSAERDKLLNIVTC